MNNSITYNIQPYDQGLEELQEEVSEPKLFWQQEIDEILKLYSDHGLYFITESKINKLLEEIYQAGLAHGHSEGYLQGVEDADNNEDVFMRYEDEDYPYEG